MGRMVNISPKTGLVNTVNIINPRFGTFDEKHLRLLYNFYKVVVSFEQS